MTLVLRPYQQEAVDSIYAHFNTKNTNPLVVLPTATGKSLVIAEFIRSALTLYPDTRIINAVHVKELVSQNFMEFHSLCPDVSAGIYSAGLGKRDIHQKVLFCGIQSVYKKALVLGACDILMIDEAHLCPKAGEGMWRTFIQDLKIANPYMKIVGLSATPFRLDTGTLTEGDGKIFDEICYEYPLLRAVEEKYVCEVVPKNDMKTTYDVSGVKKQGGEYKPGELQAVYNVDEKTQAAIDEIIEHGADRKSWLVFAAGNDHATAIHECFMARGIESALVLQSTSPAARDSAVRNIRDGKIRVLVNNLIFTTGFNAKNIDLIACFRATQSAGLWVQIVGRGFRLHPAKENCLVLDFAKNGDRHGPLDQIRGKRKFKGEGDAPIKVCPKCNAVCFAGASICPDCGVPFPEKGLDISTKASDAALLSTQQVPIWHEVLTTQYSRHTKNMRDSLKVTYITTGGKFYDFVCLEHTGYAREMAARWHRLRRNTPVPNTVGEALETWYPAVARIRVIKDGKYDRVTAVEFVPDQEVQEVKPTMHISDAHTARLADLDDIVF